MQKGRRDRRRVRKSQPQSEHGGRPQARSEKFAALAWLPATTLLQDTHVVYYVYSVYNFRAQ